MGAGGLRFRRMVVDRDRTTVSSDGCGINGQGCRSRYMGAGGLRGCSEQGSYYGFVGRLWAMEVWARTTVSSDGCGIMFVGDEGRVLGTSDESGQKNFAMLFARRGVEVLTLTEIQLLERESGNVQKKQKFECSILEGS